jgi:hypothetical protein
VHAGVIVETGGQQIPWESSSLVRDLAFVPAPAAAGAAVPPEPSAALPPAAAGNPAPMASASPAYPARGYTLIRRIQVSSSIAVWGA